MSDYEDYFIPYFCANLDGNQHTITNISLESNVEYAGFFAYNSGNIINLGLTNIDVKGKYRGAGGFAGINYGTIDRCFVKGSVAGSGSCGMVRRNSGTIANSYFRGNVLGYSGFTDNGNNVNNCYTIVEISPSQGSSTEGLRGFSDGSPVNCYWNIETSGITLGEGGEGRTTEEMTFPYSSNTYINWDWRIWKPDVNHDLNDGYPYHRPLNEVFTRTPEPAENPFPSHECLSITLNSELKWQVAFSPENTDPPEGFKLWLGTDYPPTNLADGIDLGYTNIFALAENISINLTYYWKIVPYNNVGDAANCPIWSFHTITTDGFAGGSGTQNDPWQIATAEHLNNVRNYTGASNSDKHFIQIANIDLDTAPWNQGEGWIPIKVFYGSYNGANYSINGLYINRPGISHQGLFGSTYHASIDNIFVENINIVGGEYTGGLVGYAYRSFGDVSSSITNCHSSGVVLSNAHGQSGVGGLVGFSWGTMISNSSSCCQVQGFDRYVGGLVGGITGSSINNCYFDGIVEGLNSQAMVGGISGGISNVNINSCYNYGTVLSVNNTAGGIIHRKDSGTIDKCYSTGEVQGAGIVYYLGISSSQATVSNCWSSSRVTGSGLVGQLGSSGSIINSYCYGPIMGNGKGFVGRNSGGIITNCYWDMETTGTSISAGGEGRTTAQMTYPYDPNTYVGWDFSSIWQMNSGYPKLLGQEDVNDVPNIANHPYPADNETQVIPSVLNWSCEQKVDTSNSSGFRLSLGTDYPPTNILNNVDLGWRFIYSQPTNLVCNQVYYWQVIPYNDVGYAVDCPVWSFSTAAFAGGSGTQNDPWQIATAEQLNLVRKSVYRIHENKYYIQTTDLDLGVAPWNLGEGWIPIGDENNAFYGNYSGDDHIISNLYINRPNSYNQGLFGYSSGKIQNLGLEGANVIGGYLAGALAGYNGLSGTISNCYSTGSINSDGSGGLAGSNDGTISNCYSSSNVNGNQCSGGLSGINYGTLENCYSRGSVSGDYSAGGIVGESWGQFYNCYWDTRTSGQDTSAGCEGRTTDEMTFPHTANTYVNWDWRIWKPDLDHSVNDGYPFFRPIGEQATQLPEAAFNPMPAHQSASIPLDYTLQWQVGFTMTNADPLSGFKLWLGTDNPPSNIINGLDLGYVNEYDLNSLLSLNSSYYWRVVPYNQIGEAPNVHVWSFTTFENTGFSGGNGIEQDPWQIANAEHLYNLRYYLGESHADKHFIQIANIDLGVAPWNQGEGWEPIGTSYNNSFCANYNGGGKVISNLYINRPNDDCQGLFGCTLGQIQNLGLERVSVTGFDGAGALAGSISNSTIINCHSSGSVTGNRMTGGLVGSTYSSTISNCCGIGIVSGDDCAGGLVGYNNGTISKSYSTGNVSGYVGVGGLVGSNTGTISNCYSRANVSGIYSAGGLTDEHFYSGLLINCYSTGSVSGGHIAGGLVGTNSDSEISNCHWDTQTSGQTTSVMSSLTSRMG